MKIIVFFLFFCLSLSVFSGEIRKRAVIRDFDFDARIEEVVLSDLTSDSSYEGRYFKIVKGKSNQAVNFDDPEDLQLKAATTYFHLSKARRFFSDTVKSRYVQELPQIIVRLELINVFNEIGHFANDNLDPQYNNALTVPAGDGFEPKNVKPWGIEIWFRPSKEFNIKDFKGVVDSPKVKASLTGFRNQSHMSNLQAFVTALLQGATYGGTPIDSAMRLVESSVMIEAIYQSSDLFSALFQRRIYKLDSALVPEIIYHEFSHVALSDHLELSHSTPVNEGLADFFASKIANSKKLATKIKEYNLFDGKKVKKKQQYQIAFERGEYANTDFVFGLLWKVGDTVGKDRENFFMYELSSRINTNASIRDDLLNATLETCRDFCANPFNDRIGLYNLYNSKNF